MVQVPGIGTVTMTCCRGYPASPFESDALDCLSKALGKLQGKGELSIPEGNMGAKWKEAAYLGHSITSNSYVFGCPGGIEEARSIHRRPEDERRNAEVLADITATP